MAHKRPTITDVAQIAGVSKSTVSRVLNDRTCHMRDQTRQRVIHAIDLLEYRPSSVARSLVSKRTQTVGLVVSELSNPFYSGLVHSVEDVALSAGYDVVLCNAGYDLKRGITFVESLETKNIDGVLLMCGSSDQLALTLSNQRVPAVLLEWPRDLVKGIAGIVDIDYATGIRAAADHLIDQGHSQLAHVSGPLGRFAGQMRRDIFLERVAERGLNPNNVLVIEGNFSIDGGRRALSSLMQASPRPTAVFAANDMTALGILWAAYDYGLQVPDDLAIIGLDDVALAAHVRPSLTTVALPQNTIGEVAMRMLLKLISQPVEPQEEPVYYETISTHLVMRQSTA